MAELRKFTCEEVRELNRSSQVVFVIHNKVYNVTEFLNEHPGGEEVLQDHGGKDATEDFRDIGHSSEAIELMKKYCLGEIIDSEKSNLNEKEYTGWKAGSNNDEDNYGSYENSSSTTSPGLPFYLLCAGVGIVVLAAVYFQL